MKTILERFVEVWKSDFLSKLLKDDNQKVTWQFWFSYNTVAAFVVSVMMVFVLGQVLDKGMGYLAKNYPDGKITVENGKLSTDGLGEPIFWAEGSSVFVLDTKNAKYDPSILDKYSKGYFVGSDKIYNKGNDSSIETHIYDISKIDRNFSVTQKDFQNKIRDNFGKILLIIFGFFLFMTLIFFAVFRLVSALWWALIFWLLALAVGIKELDFKKTYFAVLNFYFVVLIFQGLVTFTGMRIPLLTTLIFLLLFSSNFRMMRKQATPIVVEQQESKIEDKNEQTSESEEKK